MLFNFFLIFSYLAIFVSGINGDTIFISILISLLAVGLGLTNLLIDKKEILFPKYFPTILIFVLIMQLYLFFIQDKLNPFLYATLMAEGLIYWLIFYNLKGGDKILKDLLISFSLIYSFIYLLTYIFNINLIKLAESYFQSTIVPNHYHIGDLWVFTLVTLFSTEWKKFKFQNWLVVGLGCLFLVISNTRSAFLSLALGLGYLSIKKVVSSKSEKIITIFLFVLIAGMFIVSSLGKTTLFDRPYFLQSIESFAKYPLGVGMGNFKQIGEAYRLSNPNNTSISIYTHNIFLESLSGVGVFSIIFLAFLILLIWSVIKAKNKNIVWGAVIITILTNFMIDTSYTIPGLIWILFMAVGVFQSKEGLLNSP